VIKNNYVKTLENFKKASLYGIAFGIALFIAGIFVTVFTKPYLISAAGIGVMIASMVVFGFGMCLGLMEEYNEKTYY